MRPRPPVVLLALAIGVASPAAAQAPANPDPAALLDRAKQVLAPLDGEMRLPGLKESVEVVRDRWGVAHITAKNAADLFFAQGFVVAQDRLFQIDLWRRQAAGELAEVFGPGHIKEFLDALGRWKLPGLNFVYADVDGSIGWVVAAVARHRLTLTPRSSP